MTVSSASRVVLDALQRRGYDVVEVYAKRSRSRRIQFGAEHSGAVYSEEQGWAVRAGNAGGSFFLAASGEPEPDTSWPETRGMGLRVPEPATGPAWTAPADLDSPLIAEPEGSALLRGIDEALGKEVQGARLLSAVLEDGSSEAELVNSRGLQCAVRSRLAALRLWAAKPGAATVECTLQRGERDARRFNPAALARRLADRLIVAERGERPERDRGDVLLAPDAGWRLLEGLSPLWFGPEALECAAALRHRSGRLASDELTVVDNGRFSGGLLEAPVDGEGVITREVVLVEDGVYRQPLLPWSRDGEPGARRSGCRLRPGWRDLPRTGPTHLYVRPEGGVSVVSLLAAVARGYYFIDALGPARVDLERDRFALPVMGFAVTGGRPTGPVSEAWLCGGVRALLQGVQSLGRDLTFFTGAGCFGVPSLLLGGLEVRGGT